MAKQNVSYIERHVEKIAAGVAGAVLLFVSVTHLLMSPHAVQIAGDSVRPAEFYGKVVDQAEAARRQLEGASEVPMELAEKSKRLHEMLDQTAKAPPNELPVAAVPLSPALPEVAGEFISAPVGAKVRLAQILPPTRPILSTGKAFARLKTPRTDQPGVSVDTTAADELMLTTDLHWVVGAAVFDRKAQRDRFAKANYLSDRQEVIVAEVRVERREQLPNGQWSDPVVVQPYMDRRIVARAVLNTLAEADGVILPEDEQQYASDLRQMLYSKEAQASILRPEFQSYLADPIPANDDSIEWQIPRSLTAAGGTQVDMTAPEFGVQFFEEEGRPGGKPGPGVTADGGAQASPTVRVQKALKEAQDAIKQKKWLDAQRILDDIIASSDLTPAQRKPAEDLRKTHLRDFEEAERVAGRAGQAQESEVLGPDHDPLWFTDISVQPGKAYQYRVCLMVFNQYVGMSSRLENPADAGKLLLQGEWSEWSDVVTVPAAKHFFLADVPRDGDRVIVELWEWKGGDWLKARAELLPGDPVVAARNPRDKIDYGAILVSADPLRPYVRRSGNPKSEKFKYDIQETGAAVLVKAEGQIEEHFVAESTDRRAEVNRAIAEDRRRREVLKPLGGAVTPGVRQPPVRSPRERFPDEEPRRSESRREREDRGDRTRGRR
ncbi:MAG: hypothetical protein ACUVXJ_13755 [Phycisphaerae bacterium]